MAPHEKSVRLPKCVEFRSLSSGYSRFRWYSIATEDREHEVVVTLAPTNWRRAANQAMFFAFLWSAFIVLAWLLKPQPLNYLRILEVGAVVSLWPLYWPFLRLLILKRRLPLIRYEKDEGIVHLLGESRQVPVSDVIAICDVIVKRRGRIGYRLNAPCCELQVILQKHRATEFLLLSGSWHPSAQKTLGPLASDIARHLGICHLSVNAVDGTIVEQSTGQPMAEPTKMH